MRRVKQSPNQLANSDTVFQGICEDDDLIQFTLDIETLLHGLSSFPYLEGSIPVLPLSSQAFPIYYQDFLVELYNYATVTLPGAAFANYGSGRLLLIGSISMLFHANLTRTEITAFMENSVSWAIRNKSRTARILLLHFPSSMVTFLSQDLASFSYSIEVANDITSGFHDIIMITSSLGNLDMIGKLEKFLNEGGTIFVFYNDDVNVNLNEFLAKCGIAFSRFPFTPKHGSIPVKSVEFLNTFKFDTVAKMFFESISNDKSSSDKIDDICCVLRIYIREMMNTNDALRIYVALLKQERSKDPYKDALYHSIMAEVMPKLPPHETPIYFETSSFPLQFVNPPLIVRSVRVMLRRRTLVSSGMYLPPGVCGVITSDGPVNIQIGSHTENLLSSVGPYPRPPCIAFYRHCESQIEVSSPFGGIVYLYSDDPINLTLTFQNMSRYPLFTLERPSNWTNTCKYDAPWGEIELHTLSITMPSSSIRKIVNFKGFCEMIERLIELGVGLLGGRSIKSRRIIYDIAYTENYRPSGEIVFALMSQLDDFLSLDVPTKGLVHLLSTMFITAFPEHFFDPVAECSFVYIMACYAIKNYWNNCDPLTCLPDDCPSLFFELWKIIWPNGIDAFAKTLKIIFSHPSQIMLMGDFDKWDYFVSELTENLGVEYLEIGDRFTQTLQIKKEYSPKLEKYTIDPNPSGVVDEADADIVIKACK